MRETESVCFEKSAELDDTDSSSVAGVSNGFSNNIQFWVKVDKDKDLDGLVAVQKDSFGS